jgi:hypothetical protein
VGQDVLVISRSLDDGVHRLQSIDDDVAILSTADGRTLLSHVLDPLFLADLRELRQAEVQPGPAAATWVVSGGDRARSQSGHGREQRNNVGGGADSAEPRERLRELGAPPITWRTRRGLPNRM